MCSLNESGDESRACYNPLARNRAARNRAPDSGFNIRTGYQKLLLLRLHDSVVARHPVWQRVVDAGVLKAPGAAAAQLWGHSGPANPISILSVQYLTIGGVAPCSSFPLRRRVLPRATASPDWPLALRRIVQLWGKSTATPIVAKPARGENRAMKQSEFSNENRLDVLKRRQAEIGAKIAAERVKVQRREWREEKTRQPREEKTRQPELSDLFRDGSFLGGGLPIGRQRAGPGYALPDAHGGRQRKPDRDPLRAGGRGGDARFQRART